MKYLSSIYLFVTNPTQHEGILHIARQKIISNRSLLVNADKSGLPQYIQSKPFMPKLWVPQGYKVNNNKVHAKTAPKLESRDGDTEMKVEPLESDKVPSSAEEAKPNELRDEKKPMVITEGSKPKTAIIDAQSTQKKAWYNEDHQWLGDKVCCTV